MMQHVEMTFAEKEAMYMKLPKKQIIAMLIHCNEIIQGLGTMYHPIAKVPPKTTTTTT